MVKQLHCALRVDHRCATLGEQRRESPVALVLAFALRCISKIFGTTSHWSRSLNTSTHCRVVITGESDSSAVDMVGRCGRFNYSSIVRSLGRLLFVLCSIELCRYLYFAVVIFSRVARRSFILVPPRVGFVSSVCRRCPIRSSSVLAWVRESCSSVRLPSVSDMPRNNFRVLSVPSGPVLPPPSCVVLSVVRC